MSSVTSRPQSQAANGTYDLRVNSAPLEAGVYRRMPTRVDGRDPALIFLESQDWDGVALGWQELATSTVVRGPDTAVYASDGSHGVLNLTTRSARYRQNGSLRLAAGELRTTRADLRWAGSLGREWSLKLVGGWWQGDEFYRARTDTVEYSRPCESRDYSDCLPLEVMPPVLDGRRRAQGSVRTEKSFSGGQLLTLEGGTVELEGPLRLTGIGRLQTSDGGRPWARLAFSTPRLEILGIYSRRGEGRLDSLASGGPMYLDSDRYQLEVRANTDFAARRGRLEAGVIHWRESVDSADPQGAQSLVFAPREESRSAVYAHLRYGLSDALELEVATRLDDSPLHSLQLAPKVSVGYAVTSNHLLRLAYDQAFRLPDYAELFLQADVRPPITDLSPLEALLCQPFGVDCGLDSVRVAAVGNRTLKLEKMKGFELGYRGALGGRIFLQVNAFYSRVEHYVTDLADFVDAQYGRINPDFGPYTPPSGLPPPAAAALMASLEALLGSDFYNLSNLLDGSPALIPFSYANFGTVAIQGVNLDLDYEISARWRVKAAYSWLDFDPGSPEGTRQFWANTPDRHLRLHLAFHGQRLSGSLGYRWVGDFEWLEGLFRGPVPPLDVADLSAQWQLTPIWALGLSVSNLLNYDYYAIFGGDLMGRRALAHVELSW